ncbi:65 kDa invariant surface glycoprotein, putative [Trypanosoma brucei gambiense DAL972]|uniref:65 kDa invariant surface glycoprotein, putative n=1 Tax=Trypanosoma brucei gambiense (strain MHOM/CI/86/DAL972) TaxID=679716 RepID=C9ZJ77_TRYB9|nr:65 kDa invariant surface glycoprotein, putative [Trypanosoma brucei gambiense DAL972]CBH09436.1 65 kDa invariant surface glycoprotein, putative [Trypanosoma brucei gambiense DAL972]|eukprot:XP_011771741.1 65 kDa invariant surface glycoprotein, putative [Trypanosoma brucei gambiense DAL972]
MMKYLLVFAIITTRISVLLATNGGDKHVKANKKLDQEGANLLCKMKHLADKVANKGGEDLKKKTKGFEDDVLLEVERVNNWLEKLGDRKQYNDGYAKLSDSDIEKVKGIFTKAKDGITKQLPEAKKAADDAKKLYDEVKKAAEDARGVKVSDETNSSGLYRILDWYCFKEGENAGKSDNCDGVKFSEHHGTHRRRNVIDCGDEKANKYGDASSKTLEDTLKEWNVKKPSAETNNNGNDMCKNGQSSESHPCTMTEEWQTHYKETVEKLRELEGAHERGKKAHDAMLGYANTAHATNRKVEQGKPLTEVIAAAKEAGKKGAKIIIPAAAPSTPTNSTKNEDSAPTEHVDRGIATNETQVEVGIDADFDGLLEATEAAEVKSRHQRTAMIILAVLVPAIILVVTAVAFFIMVKRRRNNSQDVDTGKAEGGVSSGKAVM